MKRLLIIIAFLGQFFVVVSQQDPQFSLNMYNHLCINPGYAGTNDAICFTNIDRSQWLGFKGAPTTIIFNGDMALNKYNSGAGLSVSTDAIGFEKNFQVQGIYSYKIDVGKGKLGMGLSLGMLQKSINGDWVSPITLYDDNENVYLDPSIPHAVRHMSFDANIGLFYRTNDFYAGLSATHLTQSKNKTENDIMPQIKRHYYITAGYFYQLPNPLLEVRPSIFLKTDGKIMQYDINLQVFYNKMIWGGVTYRKGDAIIPMVGCYLQNNFKCAIAYDVTTSSLRKYTSGSFELMLGYCMSNPKSKKRTNYKGVRNL